nr:bifunctional nuclease domain-containing protein [Tessaracoccus coleopterorum]
MNDGVYEAELHVGGHIIDARPSDCVAVALRLGWPIQCPRSLMDQVGVEVEAVASDEVEAFRAFLDSVNADDFEDENPSSDED